MTDEEILKNPIEEYFKENVNQESTFQDLFQASDFDVDLKSDLSIEEIQIINKLLYYDSIIYEYLNFNLYLSYIKSYLRLKYSLDRKSRGEFVDINRRDRFKQNLREFSDFSNILDVKK